MGLLKVHPMTSGSAAEMGREKKLGRCKLLTLTECFWKAILSEAGFSNRLWKLEVIGFKVISDTSVRRHVCCVSSYMNTYVKALPWTHDTNKLARFIKLPPKKKEQMWRRRSQSAASVISIQVYWCFSESVRVNCLLLAPFWRCFTSPVFQVSQHGASALGDQRNAGEVGQFLPSISPPPLFFFNLGLGSLPRALLSCWALVRGKGREGAEKLPRGGRRLHADWLWTHSHSL